MCNSKTWTDLPQTDVMLRKDITLCACASREIIDRDKAATLAALLAGEGCNVVLEPDLCEKIRNGAQEAFRAASGVVLACRPRAVRALFDMLGATPAGVVDVRGGTVASVAEELGVAHGEADAGQVEEFARLIAAMPRREGADPWFPVIDKARCGECGKCHDFCLFGVYAMEDGRVVVRNPENCKNNCPACARLCPSGAIIFPKYEKSPIDGGLASEEQAVGLDPKAIYNEALRERLAARRASAGVPLFKYGGK